MKMKRLTLVALFGVCILGGCPRDPTGSSDAGQDAGPSAPRCDTDNGGCDSNAKCVQGVNARQCICLPWYSGDGLTCTKSGLQVGSPWPVIGGNARHTGQSPYRGPQTNHIYWSIQMEGRGLCSPVIDANGTIYVGAFDILHAYNPSSTELWQHSDKSVGAWSTPALGANGLLYTQASSRALYAIDPVRNPIKRVVWSYTTGDTDRIPPNIGADGTVYAGTINADLSGTLYAFPAAGATPAWQFLSTGAISTSAPGLDGTMFAASAGSGSLYAIDPGDGKQRWSIPITGGVDQVQLVIGPNGVVYVGSATGYLYAIDPATQTSRSQKVTDDLRSLALSADGTLYVGYVNGLLAIDPATIGQPGPSKWTMATRESVRYIVIGADGIIYASSDRLYAVNPDGSVKWSTTTLSSPLTSSAIAADGTLYIQDSDGILYAFQDQP